MSAKTRFPLWLKLAVFGIAGVVGTHTLHLVIARDVAQDALLDEQSARAQDIARLIARQAATALLVEDHFSLQELVVHAADGEEVAWCFIERDGVVLASSLSGGTPLELAQLRSRPRSSGPVLVRLGGRRHLDVAARIIPGTPAVVRVGLKLQRLERAGHDLGMQLGLVALAVIWVGVLAAALVGTDLVRPIRRLLAVADRFDPSQEPQHVPVTGRDELAELTERFNQMMVRLHLAHEEHQLSVRKSASSERLVALGSLVAGVAHEVNNPLAGLKNVHAALKRGDLPPDKQREYLTLMGESLQRIQEIVGRLLDFGRPRPLALKPQSVAALCGDVVRILEPSLRQRDVRLVQHAAELDGEALADRHQVGQALLNLLLNGLYVTRQGGELRLGRELGPRGFGIWVEDDGPGIPVELRDRVLDPFFTTKPEGEGTGLGLTVTRTIVDAHQGELTFDFPPGGGTRATLWLNRA